MCQSDSNKAPELKNDSISLTGPRVVTVIYDELCTFEFGIATEVFALPRPEFGADWYRFHVCSVDGKPVRATGGVEVVADSGLELIEDADLVIVPGWCGPLILPPNSLIEAIVNAHERGARIVGICGGVFVLAASNLLANKSATTHWKFLDQLIDRFPDVLAKDATLYCDVDRILTSAGSSAGIDLCLHIVRCDYGDEKAEQVARRLVFPRHRDGCQTQYSPSKLVPKRTDQKILDFLDRVEADIAVNLTIAASANQLDLSPRTFNRKIKELTGMTYGEWMSSKRIVRAKQLLEMTDLPVDKVAEACGLASTSSLRRLFKRSLGCLPNQYRVSLRTGHSIISH